MKPLRWMGMMLAVAALPCGLAAAQNAVPKPTSKLASMLEQTMASAQRGRAAGMRDFSVLSRAPARVSADGFMEVLIHSASPIGARARADLARLGARDLFEPSLWKSMPRVAMLRAWVRFDRLPELGALDWVAAVAPALPGRTSAGPIQSEGSALQGADAAHAQGITGAGIRVGVISDGAESIAEAQSRGELPAIRVLEAGQGDEGTAMLEIVHDLAPGAELLFHAGLLGVPEHLTALTRLMDAGANVIAEDVGFLEEPVFQQGVLALAGDRIAAAGVSLHSSAGNEGNTHAARVPAIGTGRGPDGLQGPFTDCGAFPPTDAVAIAPDGDTSFDVVLGEGSIFVLQWSEPRAIFPTAGQGGFTDLDLFVMDATGTRCLARSTGAQGNGKGDPIELAAPPGLAGVHAKIVVNLHGSFGAAAPPILDLTWNGTDGTLDRPTREGSLSPDANYLGLAAAVGAVRAAGQQVELETFSGAGPVQLGLTTLGDGSRGPGPALASATAPAFSAFNGVSVSGVGGFGVRAKNGGCPAKENGGCLFFGTSAAAPHSAACAALILQVLGAQTPVAEVNRRLQRTAMHDASKPLDAALGAGVVDCVDAARK